MHLTDLASLDEWKQLEQQIVDRSGLNASVFGTDGVASDEVGVDPTFFEQHVGNGVQQMQVGLRL